GRPRPGARHFPHLLDQAGRSGRLHVERMEGLAFSPPRCRGRPLPGFRPLCPGTKALMRGWRRGTQLEPPETQLFHGTKPSDLCCRGFVSMAKTAEEMKSAMIAGLKEKTGKSLDEWLSILRSSGLVKHKEFVGLLKTKHGVTHGYANMIALQALGS